MSKSASKPKKYTNYNFFVSYANADNDKQRLIEKLYKEVIKEVTEKVFKVRGDVPEIHFDKDGQSKNVEMVYKQIKNKCNQSCAFFAFISQNYLKSPWCFFEWYFFYYKVRQNSVDEELQGRRLFYVRFEDISKSLGPNDLIDSKIINNKHNWNQVHNILRENCGETDTNEVIRKWINFFSTEQEMLEVSTFGKEINRDNIFDDNNSHIKLSALNDFKQVFQNLKDSIDKGLLKKKTYKFDVVYAEPEPYSEEVLSKIWKASYDYSKKSALENKRKPVCVIYAGGTIGSFKSDEDTTLEIVNNSPIVAKNAEEFVQSLDKYNKSQKDFDFDVGFMSIGQPLDSANVESKEWIRFAELIMKLADLYQGFVILHGTNTLTYTAAALSYLLPNLDKPVILTGSESPISTESDALPNILHSIRAAAIKSPNHRMRITETTAVRAPVGEVLIYFGRDLFRGNCTFRFRAEGDHSYKMHNIKELGIQKDDYFKLTYANVINYRSHSKKGPEELKNKKLSLYYKKYLAVNINVISIYPGMEAVWDRNPENYHAFIFQGYTIGNLSTQATEWIEGTVREKKALVAIATQCTEGASDWRGYEMNEATRHCINCGAMTLESSYTKLKWLIAVYMVNESINDINASNYDKIENYVKAGFEYSIRGEYGNSEAPKQQPDKLEDVASVDNPQ